MYGKFEIAANLNDVDAQCNLGHIYYKRAHRELGMIYAYYDGEKKDILIMHRVIINIWNLILNNPLQGVNLIENYEKIIAAKWIGQYLNDLDPANHNKLTAQQ